VIGLVMEAMRNRASLVIGWAGSRRSLPTASRWATPFEEPTTVTAPASWPSSTKRCMRAAIFARASLSRSAARAAGPGTTTRAMSHRRSKRGMGYLLAGWNKGLFQPGQRRLERRLAPQRVEVRVGFQLAPVAVAGRQHLLDDRERFTPISGARL